MFASARTAAASPLASPSLKRVFEVTNAHGPGMGLGIRASGSSSMSSSSTLVSISSTMHPSSDSNFGQPVVCRPTLPRMQSSGAITSPRTPRLQCAPSLPSALSPLLPTPPGLRSPNAEGSSSDDNSSGTREPFASGSQSMNTHLTQRRRFAGTTNIARPSLRHNPVHMHPEIERIGLGISGLSLNPHRHSPTIPNINYSNDVSAPVLSDSEPEEEPIPSRRVCRRRRMTTTKPYTITKSVRFHVHAQIISSPNSNRELDGYAADNEEYNKQIPRSRMRQRGTSALSGLNSCRVRVPTPYYAPNSESSWLL